MLCYARTHKIVEWNMPPNIPERVQQHVKQTYREYLTRLGATEQPDGSWSYATSHLRLSDDPGRQLHELRLKWHEQQWSTLQGRDRREGGATAAW